MDRSRRKVSRFLHPLEPRVQIKLGMTFFVTFIIPVIVFGVLLLVSINRILVNNLFGYQESNLNQLVDELDSYLIDLNRTSRDLSSDIPFSISLSRSYEDFNDPQLWDDHLESINGRIQDRLIIEPSVLGYLLQTGADTVFASPEFSDITSLQTLVPPHVQKGISDLGQNLMLFRNSSIDPGLDYPNDVLFCAMPLSIVSLEDKVFRTGVLVLMIDTAEIDSVIQTHNPTASPMYIFDDGGSFVYSNIQEITFKKIPNDLTERAKTNKTGRYLQRDRNGNVLISFTTSRFKTVKVFGYSSDELIRNDVFFLSKFTLLFLAVLVLIFVLFIIFLSYSISSPINRLRSIMTQLEGSNFRDASELLKRRNKGILSTYFDKFYAFIYSVLTRINDYHRKEKEHEVLVLQTQINPHFVYNTLNTIRIMAELDGHERISKAIRSLIHLLKRSIKIGSVFISVRDEIEQIRDYISLQKLRYNDAFRVRFNIESSVLEFRCIKFILQPVVENAIFHGIDPGSGTGVITISVRLDENEIVYRVSDNGSGIPPETLRELNQQHDVAPSSERIGIHNVNSRLQTYFGPSSRLDIASTVGEGTTVTYRIPAEHYGG